MSATSNAAPHEGSAEGNSKPTPALPASDKDAKTQHAPENIDGPVPTSSFSEPPADQACTALTQHTDVKAEDLLPPKAPQQTVITVIHDTATATAETDVGVEADEPVYQEVALEELRPPPDFGPFFTLIEDRESGEHIHPAVHYIFSDDAPELFTNAALTAIEQQTDPTDVDERIAVIDLAPDGRTVISAVSLSPDWQNLKTTITPAPSWGEPQNANRSLLLQISSEDGSLEPPKRATARQLDMDSLVKSFADRLGLLDAVIGRLEEDERPT